MTTTQTVIKGMIVTLLAIAPSACRDSSKDVKLQITGSSTVAPLAMEIAKRYEKAHPGVRIDIQTGGSGRGVTDARQGVVDFGMVSRSLKADESDLDATSIAMDGITVIIHKDNPVTSLSNDQIIAIYTGKVTNWKEVGGNDAPITVVHKAEGRSTLELFLSYFKIKPTDVKAQLIVGDNLQDLKSVSTNKDAIGYVSIGSAEASAQAGEAIKLLAINGIEATVANVKNGSFPLSRPLNIVVKKGAVMSETHKDLLAFMQSKENADLVAAQYFVALDR